MSMKRYAIAGTGVRGMCFAQAITGSFAHAARLVALHDHNLTRARAFSGLLPNAVPCYTDFALMAREQRPDALIICTPDHTHHRFVEMAFAHGMDAIVEKPMSTDEAGVRRILDLERQYNRRVRVTFNFRYATYSTNLKRALQQEDIGPIKSVVLDWFLDKVHGTEYFRRWHANMAQSGGLLVHKSTHHFDLVNWLLDDEPTSVSAMGSLQTFGRNGPFRGPCCRKCPHAPECPYYLDVSSWDAVSGDRMRKLYFEAEAEDGYVRDRCVFREDIDIYDTMHVLVNYRRGAQMAYSLIAYAPYEGYRLTLTGTRGRIEAEEYFGGLMMKSEQVTSRIRVIYGQTRKDTVVRDIEFPTDKSDHGGGDARLYRHLFEENVPDPLGQAAGARAGAESCLIGICANRSIREGRLIPVPDLGQRAGAGQAAVTSARAVAASTVPAR